jgi:serine/threonine protein kinase
MGATCCKEGKATEEVLTTEQINCKLVRDRGTEFHDTYEVVEVIGEGSISTISKIKRKVAETAQQSSEVSTAPDHYYAVKEINTLVVSPAVVAEMNNEIDLLKRLVCFPHFLSSQQNLMLTTHIFLALVVQDHPNIVKVYETYELKGKTAVVMELCTGGDLFSRHPYSERQASNMVRQILSAAIYLHDRNIVHRDLKYENIMFADADKDDFTVMVIDFGLAKKYLYTHDRLFERVGTVRHLMS